MDLQSMSEKPHENCPECGKACERVLSAPLVSVRGSEYRAAERAERRSQNVARAHQEHDKLRAETERRVLGHTHNCVAAGCFGQAARAKYFAENQTGNQDDRQRDYQAAVNESRDMDPLDSGTVLDSGGTGERIQGMPYLVGRKAES